MAIDIQPADPRLRRVTAIVLGLSVIAAIIVVIAFWHWINHLAERLPTRELIVELRRGIAFAMLACAMCLLLLAGYSARLARQVSAERRWPLAATRVLRDTRIRREASAKKIADWMNIAGVVLMLLALAAGLLSWRLFTAG